MLDYKADLRLDSGLWVIDTSKKGKDEPPKAPKKKSLGREDVAQWLDK
jgi:hypothetical protein